MQPQRAQLRVVGELPVAVGVTDRIRTALGALLDAACRATESRHGAIVVFADGRVSDVICRADAEGTFETVEVVLGARPDQIRKLHPGVGSGDVAPPDSPSAHTVLLDIPITVMDQVAGTLLLAGHQEGCLVSGAQLEAARSYADAAGTVLSAAGGSAGGEARARGLDAAASVAHRLAAPGAATALSIIAEEARRVAGGDRSAVVIGPVLAAVDDGAGVGNGDAWRVGQLTEVLGSAVAAAVDARRATLIDGTAVAPLVSGPLFGGVVVVAGDRERAPLPPSSLDALRAFAPGAAASLALATACAEGPRVEH